MTIPQRQVKTKSVHADPTPIWPLAARGSMLWMGPKVRTLLLWQDPPSIWHPDFIFIKNAQQYLDRFYENPIFIRVGGSCFKLGKVNP